MMIKHMVAEVLVRVGESGIIKGATVARMSGTWNKGKGYCSNVLTKDGSYHSVKNGAI